MKKYIMCIVLSLGVAGYSNATVSDAEAITIATGMTTASPLLTIFGVFYVTDEGTSDGASDRSSNRTQTTDTEPKEKKLLRAAYDDAIVYVATNGEQGKTAKFEAAAQALRKTKPNLTDAQVADVILGLEELK